MGCGISGEQSSSSGNQAAGSGFSYLPKEMQDAWKQYATQIGNKYSTDQSSAFKLPELNAGSQKAISDLSNSAFAPTEKSINENIALQSNPYDSSVIDTINREARGSGSQLSQSLNEAGQFGSNRATLGANDIDLTRLNQIGTFKQNQFNTALNNALTTIPQAQTTAAQNSMAAGLTQQGQEYQNQQAPYTALQSYGQSVGILPTTGGSSSVGRSESQSAGGSI